MSGKCTALAGSAVVKTAGAFNNLFYGSTGLADASKLEVFPNTFDKSNAYMFYMCTNLSAAPDLPDTNLTMECYT